MKQTGEKITEAQEDPEKVSEKESEKESESKQEKEYRRTTRWDLLLLAGILLLSGALFLLLKAFLPRGNTAVVSVEGKTVMTLPLNEDTEREISTPEGTNTLRISGGEVSVSAADCPDRLCVKHSAIHTSGETIVCLPHKLIVEVHAE